MREGKAGQVDWEMEWMMKFCEGMIERKYQTCLRRNENNRLEKEADRKKRLRNVTDDLQDEFLSSNSPNLVRYKDLLPLSTT